MSFDSFSLVAAAIPVSVTGVTAVWAIRQDVSPLRLLERMSVLLEKTEPGSVSHVLLGDVFTEATLEWGLRRLRPAHSLLRLVSVITLIVGFVLAFAWVGTRSEESLAGPWWSWGLYLLSILSFVGAINTARSRRKKIEAWMDVEKARRRAAADSKS